ncbi:MAG: hypothetical protein N2V72_01275 [Methanophagales archaeon]|nr:hypothetical protein [Methanophagales archaeon]
MKLQWNSSKSGVGIGCLIRMFEDRAVLQKPDLEVIKKLGLKFRGRMRADHHSGLISHFPLNLENSKWARCDSNA